MKIGILGTGNMGDGLGRLWAAAGHQVCFGSRAADRAKALAAEVGHGTSGGAFVDAAAFGEMVLLSVPGFAAVETVRTLADTLRGKPMIDLTNTLSQTDFGLSVGTTTSMAEIIAEASGANVVKAFNTIHVANLQNPIIDGIRADGFYCGDDGTARSLTRQLIIDAGFEPVDCGPLKAARYLEPLAGLWIYLAYNMGGKRETAFKLLGR